MSARLWANLAFSMLAGSSDVPWKVVKRRDDSYRRKAVQTATCHPLRPQILAKTGRDHRFGVLDNLVKPVSIGRGKARGDHLRHHRE
jgi:hypothetical protein